MNGFLSFQEPLWLLALGVIPALGFRAVLDGRRRRREWGELGRMGQPSKAGDAVWLAALACLILALARPGWGRSAGEDEQAGRDVVLAIDTSRSMGCEDAVPDRLGVAIRSAESLVRAHR